MPNERQSEVRAVTDEAQQQGPSRPAFDLEERTALFGESVIEFCQPLPRTAVTKPLISQLVRSSSSIGANYCEADESATRREFRYRISLCRREARETKHWLRMLVSALPDSKETARQLWKEADELTRIFAAIHRNSGPNS
jgi:four helix bundle protein